jgi:ankyrin repeat protein
MKKMMVAITSVLLTFLFVGCAMNKSLHIPAGKGDLDRVKAEIDSGKDVNSKDIAGQTALMYASEQGRLEVVKYLVENGADVNAQSGGHGRGTALIYASAANRITVMEYLLEHDAGINATTAFNETALFWATAKGHVKAVNLLLNKKADTKIKNKKGKTALDLAKDLNREEIERMLSGE